MVNSFFTLKEVENGEKDPVLRAHWQKTQGVFDTEESTYQNREKSLSNFQEALENRKKVKEYKANNKSSKGAEFYVPTNLFPQEWQEKFNKTGGRQNTNIILNDDDTFDEIAKKPPLGMEFEAQIKILSAVRRPGDLKGLTVIFLKDPPPGREKEFFEELLKCATKKLSASSRGRSEMLAGIAKNPPRDKLHEFQKTILENMKALEEDSDKYHVSEGLFEGFTELAKKPLPGREWESQEEILRCAEVYGREAGCKKPWTNLMIALIENPPPGKEWEFYQTLRNITPKFVENAPDMAEILATFAENPPPGKESESQNRILNEVEGLGEWRVPVIKALAKNPPQGEKRKFLDALLTNLTDPNEPIMHTWHYTDSVVELAKMLPTEEVWEFQNTIFEKIKFAPHAKNIIKNCRLGLLEGIIEGPPSDRECDSRKKILEIIDTDIIAANHIEKNYLFREMARRLPKNHERELHDEILKRVNVGKEGSAFSCLASLVENSPHGYEWESFQKIQIKAKECLKKPLGGSKSTNRLTSQELKREYDYFQREFQKCNDEFRKLEERIPSGQKQYSGYGSLWKKVGSRSGKLKQIRDDKGMVREYQHFINGNHREPKIILKQDVHKFFSPQDFS